MSFNISITIKGYDFLLTCDSPEDNGVILNCSPEQLNDSNFIEALKIALDIHPAIEAAYSFEDHFECMPWENAVKIYNTAHSSTHFDASKVLGSLDHYFKRYAEYHTSTKQTKRSKHEEPGFVYLLQSPTNAYKIGKTRNPQDRIKTFEVKLPFEVEFIALIQTEAMHQLEQLLHDMFAGKHVNGEWFNLSTDDVEYIKGLAQ